MGGVGASQCAGSQQSDLSLLATCVLPAKLGCHQVCDPHPLLSSHCCTALLPPPAPQLASGPVISQPGTKGRCGELTASLAMQGSG